MTLESDLEFNVPQRSKMSSDILSILIKRVKGSSISEDKRKEISKRLNDLDERSAATAARLILSYKIRFDGDTKIIGQNQDDIPYSGKQLNRGLQFHSKMIPDKLFLILEQLIFHIDNDQ